MSQAILIIEDAAVPPKLGPLLDQPPSGRSSRSARSVSVGNSAVGADGAAIRVTTAAALEPAGPTPGRQCDALGQRSARSAMSSR
jgi:hypothetical protein